MSEGINPNDAGVRLLARGLERQPSRDVLLVHCGDLPGLAPGATRLVLDVRERTDSVHHCVADRIDASDEPTRRGADRIDASDEPTRRGADRIDASDEPTRTEGTESSDPWLGSFRHALVWPRAHLGLDFTRRCLALGALHLHEGGELRCSVRKRKGAERIAATIEALLGHVEVEARDSGYRLLVARKNERFDAALARELEGIRYALRDPRLHDVVLESAPGVFSRTELDAGTARLIDWARSLDSLRPSTVLDLCAGIGPLTIWAAQRWPSARVHAVESNVLAADLASRNVDRAGVGARVRVHMHAGLPDDPSLSQFDLALVNPPGHLDKQGLRALLAPLFARLTPHGRALFVLHRVEPVVGVLRELAPRVDVHAEAPYWLAQAWNE